MKRLAWVVVLACACGGPPPARSVEIEPLPSPPASAGSREPPKEERPVVHEQRADRDGDGIVDDLDKCPDDPEDHDGFQDEDGCPDLDNDADGILDARDKCPNDPGPPADGCPKKRP